LYRCWTDDRCLDIYANKYDKVMQISNLFFHLNKARLLFITESYELYTERCLDFIKLIFIKKQTPILRLCMYKYQTITITYLLYFFNIALPLNNKIRTLLKNYANKHIFTNTIFPK